MNTPNEERDYNSAYNPFPEPQTIPAGWDAEAVLFAPRTDSVMDEEDTTEV